MRTITPKTQIEYTFRINGAIYQFVYVDVNDKGRLIFENVRFGNLVTMLPKRFSYLHRFNLISEKKIDNNQSTESTVIKELNELSEDVSAKIQKEIGVSSRELASELQFILTHTCSIERKNKALSDMIRARKLYK